ncbi:aminoglycoside phosphotransferase family protein [Streptomyces sp. NPDC050145]|uniref:aminoglycoside phosphotransferase family protein n=1 Tax=Streptomyces sp. NPDC050145 TaxID=3365602 RepID=UPI0037A3D8D4
MPAGTRGPEIDEPLVRALLREQHADLAELHLRHAATGWSHQLWRIGEDLAVRLPCTDADSRSVHNEQRWLPGLTPELPLPAPQPRRHGVPSARFPRPWTVTTWIPGTPADRTPIAPGTGSAPALAAFLRALHRPAPADAPAHPGRGVPLETLAADFENCLGEVEGIPDVPGTDALRALWDDAVAAPVWSGPRLWLHSDLHPANVVVDATGRLSGVIDFGDLCAGDPAGDLCAAWTLLPEGEAGPLLAAYGADPETVRRARGWAVLRALGLVLIGRAGDWGLPGGQPTWGPAGRAALRKVVGDAGARAA